MSDTQSNTRSNVRQITDKQAQPACRFTIQATLRGFPITIEGEGRAGDLKIIVDRLFDLGAEPPIAQAAKPAASEQAKKAAPKCAIHNSPMKQGRRGWFCPRKDDDGYCDQTA